MSANDFHMLTIPRLNEKRFVCVINFLVYLETESRNMTKTVTKHEIKDTTRETLTKHLAPDIEFYQFVKKRFYDLLEKTKGKVSTKS